MTHPEILVKANQSKRTFTIRNKFPDGTVLKYRTNKLTKEEFEQEEFNTSNDWRQFLKTDNYYKVN